MSRGEEAGCGNEVEAASGVPAAWFARVGRELSSSGSPRQIQAMLTIRAVAHRAEAVMADWLASHGLTLGQFNVLICLWGAPGLARPMSEVRRAVISSPAHATKLVDQLEAMGLVRREPDPRDRRVLLARLTAAGQEQVAAVAPPHVARVEGVMNVLTDAECAELIRLLARVRLGFDRAAAGTAPDPLAAQKRP